MECTQHSAPAARGFKQHLHRARFIQRLYWFLFFAMGSVVLQGCSGIDEAEWKEEVKLSDGNVIVVERKAHTRSNGFPDAPRGSDIDTELRYEAQGIYWKGTYGIARTVRSFDRVDGVYYIVRYAENITACANKKPDAYAIQILKWANGQWLEIPQAEAPVDRILINLEANPWGRKTATDLNDLLYLNGNIRGRDDISRSNRTNPETLQSYYERTALDPRTQQRRSDEDQYRANFHLCGYWHRRVPAFTSMEELHQRVVARQEAEKRNKQLEAEQKKQQEAEQKKQQEAERQKQLEAEQPETQLNAPAENT